MIIRMLLLGEVFYGKEIRQEGDSSWIYGCLRSCESVLLMIPPWLDLVGTFGLMWFKLSERHSYKN